MAEKTNADKINAELKMVAIELSSAMDHHQPMHNAHEAYSVILEELDEFWQEVKLKREQRNRVNIRTELRQIAAMAVRAVIDLDLK